MNVDKKILAAVKKSFSKFDFSRLDEICKNEAQTRMYLIEPMCEMLGYSRSDAKDMLTEITAGWGEKRDLADIGLIIKGKKPEIIIECKKLGFKLTDKEGNQLNNYFNHTEGSKIGILTNGMEWRFAGGAPIPVNPKAPPPHNNTITITGNISVNFFGSHAYHIRTFLSRD